MVSFERGGVACTDKQSGGASSAGASERPRPLWPDMNATLTFESGTDHFARKAHAGEGRILGGLGQSDVALGVVRILAKPPTFVAGLRQKVHPNCLTDRHSLVLDGSGTRLGKRTRGG